MQAKTLSKLENVYRICEERILSGTWLLGCQIPTEAELVGEFGCSRSTVGKAIARLVHEGLVERRTSAGTRVINNSIKQNRSSVELDAVAFIFPSEKHEGIWRTVRGFQDAARDKGRRVVLLSSGADFQKEIEFVGRLSEFDVRGAAVYPIFQSADDQVQFSKTILAVKFPLVLAEVNLLGLERPSVILDGFHAGHTMARHLIERGCKRIGFFANYARVPSVRDRYIGFRAALEEANLPIQPQRVFLESGMRPNFVHPISEASHLAHRYFEKCSDIDGLVCVNDFLARGALDAARERGMSVPEVLKITGMEDFAFSKEDEIQLTTYRVPFERMGAECFSVLEAILSKKFEGPVETQVRGELVVRNSSAPKKNL